MQGQGLKSVRNESGFSLIEILVGLVIGLLATLVIMQVFAVFEGQKRTSMGGADAQTNGSIALFSIQRDAQMAGFGLPVFNTQNPPLKCDPSPTVDHDSNALTPNIGIFPLTITDGGSGAGASDSLAINYSRDGASTMGGIASPIISVTGNTTAVDNNLGCNNGDVVLASSGTACVMTKVNDATLTVVPRVNTTKVNLLTTAGLSNGWSLACLGSWNQFVYSVANNQLLRNDASLLTSTPIVADIVNIQAQYGVSAIANSNQVVNWVNATAGSLWDPALITVANRNRIKAVRIAVVARNGLMEQKSVTTTCTTTQGTVNNGPCAWDDTGLDAAPKIDLSNITNWQQYRYRVYETVIPLRNMIWSKNTL